MPPEITITVLKDLGGLLKVGKVYRVVVSKLMAQFWSVDEAKDYCDLEVSKELYYNLLENGHIMMGTVAQPQMISPASLTELKQLLEEYIKYVASPEYHSDNDWQTWIYEKTLTTFYGEHIFDWINKH